MPFFQLKKNLEFPNDNKLEFICRWYNQIIFCPCQVTYMYQWIFIGNAPQLLKTCGIGTGFVPSVITVRDKVPPQGTVSVMVSVSASPSRHIGSKLHPHGTTLLVSNSIHTLRPYCFQTPSTRYDLIGFKLHPHGATLLASNSTHTVRPYWFQTPSTQYDLIGFKLHPHGTTLLVSNFIHTVRPYRFSNSIHTVRPYWFSNSIHTVRPYWFSNSILVV